MNLNVSSIQHFSVGDGPGIRTTIFLKGCHLRCPWCHNPETLSLEPVELFFEKTKKRVVYGMHMAVETLANEVLEDEAFYRESGGGVTVSGGEPLQQSLAVEALFAVLKQKRISTLVDTAGDLPWEAFERVIPVTDIFYYDVKTGDEKMYASVIGGSGRRIYDNLRHLIDAGCQVHARVPLIPRFNTSVEDSQSICRRLLTAGVKKVDLIPFHRMGIAKYQALNKEYTFKDTPPLGSDEIATISKYYQKYFDVTIE